RLLKSADAAPNGSAPRRPDEGVRSHPARQDVNDLWDYIAGDNVEAADGVLDALETAMAKLAKNPGIGHWREELTDKRHRFFLVFSYLIVSRRTTRPLQILRFFPP